MNPSRCLVAVCVAAGLLVAVPSFSEEPAEAFGGLTPYERHLTLVGRQFGVLLDRIGDLGDTLAPAAEAMREEMEPGRADVHQQVFGFMFGDDEENRGAVEEYLAVRLEAYWDQEIDVHERAGMVHLAGGRFAEAEASFEAALDGSPDRPLALFWAGVAAFEARQWDRAATWFARAGAYDAALPTAHLLGRTAELASEREVRTDAELWPVFVEAYVEVDAEHFPEGWPHLETPWVPRVPYVEAPVLVRGEAAVIDQTDRALRSALEEAEALDDPERNVPLLLAFNEETPAVALIKRLADRVPPGHELAVAIHVKKRLEEHAAHEAPDEREQQEIAWRDLQADVDRFAAGDPDNGFWSLMRIEPRVVEPFDEGLGDFVEIDVPFTESELDTLGAAASAPRFEPVGLGLGRRVRAARRQWLGAFVPVTTSPQRYAGLTYRELRQIARRIPGTTRAVVERDGVDAAWVVLRDFEKVSRRFCSVWPDAIRVLVDHSVAALVESEWRVQRGSELDPARVRWLADAIESRSQTRYCHVSFIMAVALGEMLPLERTRGAHEAFLAEGPAGDAAREASYRFAIEQDRVDADTLEDRRDTLQRALDEPAVEAESFTERMIVHIGHTGDAEARLLLEALRGRGDAVTDELIARALRRIEVAAREETLLPDDAGREFNATGP